MMIKHVGVSIPQAVWIACNCSIRKQNQHSRGFQYRKRYGLHAMKQTMNNVVLIGVSIPQAVWIACNVQDLDSHVCWLGFQYRKRYGLHAIVRKDNEYERVKSFNTASGMDCMQYCLPEALETVNPKTEFLTMTPFSRFSPK